MSGPEMDHGHVAVLQPITNETHVATDSFDASPALDDREALVELDLKNNATFGTDVAPLTTHLAEDASTISFVNDDKVDDIKGTVTPVSGYFAYCFIILVPYLSTVFIYIPWP